MKSGEGQESSRWERNPMFKTDPQTQMLLSIEVGRMENLLNLTGCHGRQRQADLFEFETRLHSTRPVKALSNTLFGVLKKKKKRF